MDECKHERIEEMRGIIFCTSCGEEIERFFGLLKNLNINYKKWIINLKEPPKHNELKKH